eukprot:jgi/Bigna1/80381/fgenesh1_pg.70_\
MGPKKRRETRAGNFPLTLRSTHLSRAGSYNLHQLLLAGVGPDPDDLSEKQRGELEAFGILSHESFKGVEMKQGAELITALMKHLVQHATVGSDKRGGGQDGAGEAKRKLQGGNTNKGNERERKLSQPNRCRKVLEKKEDIVSSPAAAPTHWGPRAIIAHYVNAVAQEKILAA